MTTLPDCIGRYEVLSLLGQGGMGVLYLARDPVIDRHVALKLLKVDNEDLRRRFVREARSAGRLQHPNIVTVYDVGDHDGELFIAMEFIDGDTLATLIRDDVPFSTLRKLEMLDQLADGLAFAHTRSIIHRDIKPANLMLTRGGLLKVLDFGIARIAHREMSAASMAGGSLIGTPAYMAPEQLAGEMGDHRADIFAVGLVMYELLSGRRAFTGSTTAEILENVRRAEPVPLNVLVPHIDPDLVRCVNRALAKRPDDRYQALQELRGDIGKVRRRSEYESGSFDATIVVPSPPQTRAVAAPRAAPPPETPASPPAATVHVSLDPSPARPPSPTTPRPISSAPPGVPMRVDDADAPTVVIPVYSADQAVSPAPMALGRPDATPPGFRQEAPPPDPPTSRSPPPARHSMLPALIVLAIVAVMLVVATLGALWWLKSVFAGRLEPMAATASEPVPVEMTDAPAGPAPAPAAVPDSASTPPAIDRPATPITPAAAAAPEPSSVRPVPQRPPSPPASQQAPARQTSTSGATRPDPEVAAPAAPPVAPPAPPPPPARAAVASASTPAGTGPEPVTTDVPRDEALSLVRAYVASRNTAHAAGIRRVWPTVTDTALRRMTGEFSAPLTLTDCDVAAIGAGRARATCRFTQPGSSGFSGGTALTLRRQLVFDIATQGRGWVITNVAG